MVGRLVKKLLWLLLIGSIVVAVTRGAGGNASSWGDWLTEQHKQVQTWISGVGETVVENLPESDGTIPGTEPSTTDNSAPKTHTETPDSNSTPANN